MTRTVSSPSRPLSKPIASTLSRAPSSPPLPGELAPPKLDAKASGPVRFPIADFYLTNAICRASPTMRRCSDELLRGVLVAEAAE